MEPTFRPFPWNGDQAGKEDAITAYIVGENIRRRHLNAGQRAVLLAIAYPDAKRGRPGKGSESEHLQDVPRSTLSEARAIVKWCPEYVEDILAGITGECAAFLKIGEHAG